MSGININKTTGIFNELKVYNKNTRFEISNSGNYIHRSNNTNIISNNILTNVSDGNILYKSNKGNININCLSNTKNINLKSGTNTNKLINILENDTDLITPEVSFINNTVYDDSNSINNIINNSSIVLESTDEIKKGICLYSNNEINQLSHNNINIVSDKEIILQSSNKLHLSSLDYITFNSEKMIGTIEEEIILLSSTKDITLGGNGNNDFGIKIHNNNNYFPVSIGYDNNIAKRNLDINIKNSIENNKNGILIKNLNNNNIIPDIEINSYYNTTDSNKLNLGIGKNEFDKDNKIFIKKNIEQGLTFIEILNNNTFNNNDINKEIKYSNTNFINDTIISLVNNKKAYIKSNNTSFVNEYEEAFILRNDNSYLKTNTNNYLTLGTNNNDIIHLNNNGNVGINKNNSINTLDITNNYNIFENIRINKNTSYLTSKTLSVIDNNFIIVCKTLNNNKYNLDIFLYNSNKKLINHQENILGTGFNISITDIKFDIDLLKNNNDNTNEQFIICYSYQSGIKDIDLIIHTKTLIYFTKDLKFNNNGISTSSNTLETLSNPIVKSYKFTTNILKIGYIIGFLDKDASDRISFNFIQGDNNNFNIKLTTSDYTNITNQILDFLKTEESFTGTINIIIESFNFNIKENNIIICFNMNILHSGITNRKYYNLITKLNMNINPDLSLTTDTFKYIVQSNTNNNKSSTTIKTCGFDIKNINDNEFIISYYLKKISDNKIQSVYYEKFNINNTVLNYTSNSLKKLDDITNKYIYSNTYNDIFYPSISLIDNNQFIISYIYLKNQGSSILNLKYYNSNNNNSIEFTDYNNLIEPNLLSLTDSNNNYLTTFLYFTSKITDNNYELDSILFKEINSITKLIDIKNNTNSKFEILNDGNININGTKTTINNLILEKSESTENNLKNTTGMLGEIKYIKDTLYIYLPNSSDNNNSWKKIKLNNI